MKLPLSGFKGAGPFSRNSFPLLQVLGLFPEPCGRITLLYEAVVKSRSPRRLGPNNIEGFPSWSRDYPLRCKRPVVGPSV